MPVVFSRANGERKPVSNLKALPSKIMYSKHLKNNLSFSATPQIVKTPVKVNHHGTSSQRPLVDISTPDEVNYEDTTKISISHDQLLSKFEAFKTFQST